MGAILHLALTLGAQVLVPNGMPDAFALLLAVLGLAALLSGRLGVVTVIALSALAGGLRFFF